MQDLYGDGSHPDERLSRCTRVDEVCVELLDRYVDGDVLYVTCIGVDVNEDSEVWESRESERDIATDTRAGVIFDVGDM